MSTKLPNIQISSINQSDSASDLVVINHSPYPGELDVRKDTAVSFDIISLPRDGEPLMTESGEELLTEDDLPILSTTVNLVDYLDSTSVSVGGVEVFRGGSLQNGWTGLVAASGDGQDTISFSFVPPTIFESSSNLEVLVELYDTSIGIDPVSSRWSFTTQDTVRPIVTLAEAVDINSVIVTFDSPVRLQGDTLNIDGLKAANYNIQPIEVPAVVPNVVEAVTFSNNQVRLTTDIPLTFGKLYNLNTQNVADLSGNQVVPTNIEFTSFSPNVPEGRDFDLYSLVAQINRDEDSTQDLKKFLACLQDTTDLLFYKIDRWTNIYDAEIADEKWLDLILQDLSNPFPFVESFSTNQKRKFISVLVDIYKSKGTKKGIKNVIRSFLGLEVVIESSLDFGWFLGEDELGVSTVLGPGTRFQIYSFDVISPVVLTEQEVSIIRDIVDYMKPAHTHLISIVQPTSSDTVDHWELGSSQLGITTILHETS